MNLTNYFDISRFWLLLKMQLFRSRKGILVVFVIAFGLLFFAGLLLDILVDQRKVIFEHNENYVSSLLLGGFILSSLAFNDLSNTLKRYSYLTLPVSTFEKFLCMWLLTSVGWIVLFTLAYTLYTVIASEVGHSLFSRVTFLAFEPLGIYSLTSIRFYFVLQGIFLVGAAHFKGYVFPKTLFILILFLTVCGAITYFILEDVFLNGHDCGPGECILVATFKVHPVWLVTKWVFWWILAPLCWLATYFGLKEQEV